MGDKNEPLSQFAVEDVIKNKRRNKTVKIWKYCVESLQEFKMSSKLVENCQLKDKISRLKALKWLYFRRKDILYLWLVIKYITKYYT